ncbi:hypothetical protein [Povalibacter sp.]|uniref:hypothetical protein n=1 Tax=Povalibacter sp. TaxID=1962978 RepID=UPI002F3E21AD
MTRFYRMLSVVLLMCSAAQSQSDPSPMPACLSPLFRQFDFWIGDWDVRNPAGELAGRNTITAEQGGCVIVEKWQSVAGNGGMSMSYYEPQSGRWKQNWLSPGGILEMSGGMRGDSLIMEGPMQYLGKEKTTLLRGTWTPLPDGRVRQHFVESTDGGKTWTEWFDGYYRRIDN